MKKYFSGILVYAGIKSLHQDIIGKEKYIQMVEAGWIDSWITVPLAIMCLLFAVWLYVTDKTLKG